MRSEVSDALGRESHGLLLEIEAFHEILHFASLHSE